jgi:hypothetical protein
MGEQFSPRPSSIRPISTRPAAESRTLVEQQQLDLAAKGGFVDDLAGPSGETRVYNPTDCINAVRQHVNAWCQITNPVDWKVIPETARQLQHWHHDELSKTCVTSLTNLITS